MPIEPVKKAAEVNDISTAMRISRSAWALCPIRRSRPVAHHSSADNDAAASTAA